MIYADPTTTVDYEFADFGSIYSPDGREYPLTGQATFSALRPLLSVSPQPQTINQQAQQQAGKAETDGTPAWVQKILDKLFDKIIPKHIGARLIVGTIAVVLLVVVAVRLTQIK